MILILIFESHSYRFFSTSNVWSLLPIWNVRIHIPFCIHDSNILEVLAEPEKTIKYAITECKDQHSGGNPQNPELASPRSSYAFFPSYAFVFQRKQGFIMLRLTRPFTINWNCSQFQPCLEGIYTKMSRILLYIFGFLRGGASDWCPPDSVHKLT